MKREYGIAVQRRPRSVALKFRVALLEESPNAFAAILGEEALHLLSDFRLQGVCQLVFFGAKNGLLNGTDREGRPLRDFYRQHPRRVFEFRRGRQVIDDAHAKRGLRVDHVAGVEQLGGFGRAD